MNQNFIEKIKQVYANQNTHNQAVDRNLEELEKLLPQVQNHQQLLFRLKYWQGDQRLHYENLIFFPYFDLALLSLTPVFTVHFSFLILTFIFLALGVPKLRVSNPLFDFTFRNHFAKRSRRFLCRPTKLNTLLVIPGRYFKN